MKTLAILAVAAAVLPTVVVAQRKPVERYPAPIPPAPPLPGAQGLIGWQVEGMDCAGTDLPDAAVMLPRPAFGWMQQGAPLRVTLDFAIDDAGRPVDIRRSEQSYVPNADDLAPALAASNFAAGAPHRQCQAHYVATRSPIAAAAVPDLIAATIDARPSREAIERIKPTGSDCFDKPLEPLLRGYPDFRTLKGSVGRLQWSMVQFDIDAAGKPVAVHTLTGTHDGGLDAAARAAVAKSRFAGGKRSGCLYPYWKSATPRPAPDSPDKQGFRPESATCPVELDWAVKPVLQYPDNYRKRGIEGWAIVAFDAAPWGATGNVRVLAAEPAADFGTTAINVVAAARLAPSNQGYVGCVERVRYVMTSPGGAEAPAD
ncbi:energy transducer TonB [Sphingomonas panacisoli]|uniref:Energy transducer TonB n=1 Tax=Sphingomonas panacisoli TaxID=1813879 RepID=A0A5B8LG36_9SPHN|nr:energy transducer TonB [Sphingomonas panacisoli]QDZ07167.1 energy transducer TonB [Sphingomonas panacisoli]